MFIYERIFILYVLKKHEIYTHFKCNMAFLEIILAVLICAIICYLATIIVLAFRKKFFLFTFINTLVFMGYCYVSYHYDTFFNTDIFNKNRIIFLLTCVLVHAIVSLIWASKMKSNKIVITKKQSEETKESIDKKPN